MSKILYVEIRNCLDCPYLTFSNTDYISCEYPDYYQGIEDPKILPDWCPLPDAKEEVK